MNLTAVGLVKMLPPGRLQKQAAGRNSTIKCGDAFVGGSHCAEPASRQQSN